MAQDFLHGVETVEVTSGAVPITVVRSAVIGLVGLAPYGPKQKLTLVQSESDASVFGPTKDFFTIPHALKAVQAQGSGTVMVVNVFDEDQHLKAEIDEVHNIVSGKTQLTWQPYLGGDTYVPSAVVVGEDPDPDVALVLDQDYTLSESGEFKIIPGGAAAEGDGIKITYYRMDLAQVELADLIGQISSGSQVRTGTKLFEEAYQKFGFTPRLFIVPGFSDRSVISDTMIQMADKYRGHAIIDAPQGATVPDAIESRSATTNGFKTSSKRAILVYPMLKAFNTLSEVVELQPYSQFEAGVIAATDAQSGYWYSPSNKEIRGIVGAERMVTAAINDANTEANQLNAAGISTVFNSFGTGMRTWGNRAASFPSSTHPSNFISVQRTADILNDSIEYAMLAFLDKPITPALIDAIRDSVNGFMNVLISRGAIIDGICMFDPGDNPATEVAQGRLKFRNTFMPPTPAERITFYSNIDLSILSKLLSANNA